MTLAPLSRRVEVFRHRLVMAEYLDPAEGDVYKRQGLGTFVDPRHGGGRMNAAATRTLADVLEIDGREVMRYRPFPVDIALLRGSYADADGNISFAQELSLIHI